MDVRGIDLAVDYLFTDIFSVALTYSNINRNIFEKAPGSTPTNPLTANAAKHRGSLAFRWADEAKGWSTEVRTRYADAFPVNSGVYNSFGNNTPIPYDQVPVNLFFDAGFSWRLPFAQNVRWAVNAQNILNNEVPSFVGVAPVGRFVSTRIQYGF